MANKYIEEGLSSKDKDITRVISSLIEEAEAISFYHERVKASSDEQVKEILKHAQEEEMEHFAIDLEWLSREMPEFKEVLKGVLFKEGDITDILEEWEENE